MVRLVEAAARSAIPTASERSTLIFIIRTLLVATLVIVAVFWLLSLIRSKR